MTINAHVCICTCFDLILSGLDVLLHRYIMYLVSSLILTSHDMLTQDVEPVTPVPSFTILQDCTALAMDLSREHVPST